MALLLAVEPVEGREIKALAAARQSLMREHGAREVGYASSVLQGRPGPSVPGPSRPRMTRPLSPEEPGLLLP